jgi:hypothetical protein
MTGYMAATSLRAGSTQSSRGDTATKLIARNLLALIAPRASFPPRARARDDEPVLLAPEVHPVVAGRTGARPAAALAEIAPRRQVHTTSFLLMLASEAAPMRCNKQCGLLPIQCPTCSFKIMLLD